MLELGGGSGPPSAETLELEGGSGPPSANMLELGGGEAMSSFVPPPGTLDVTWWHGLLRTPPWVRSSPPPPGCEVRPPQLVKLKDIVDVIFALEKARPE
eukprot:6049361-Prymnesium_polylepis.1